MARRLARKKMGKTAMNKWLAGLSYNVQLDCGKLDNVRHLAMTNSEQTALNGCNSSASVFRVGSSGGHVEEHSGRSSRIVEDTPELHLSRNHHPPPHTTITSPAVHPGNEATEVERVSRQAENASHAATPIEARREKRPITTDPQTGHHSRDACRICWCLPKSTLFTSNHR